MNVFKELIGLFVDDGSLAVAILAWVGLVKTLLVRLQVGKAACSFLLFFGLVVLLVENAFRSARRIRAAQHKRAAG